MKSISMNFVRDGDIKSVLEKGRTYHVIIESSKYRHFTMPLGQDEFLTLLAEVRYHKDISDQKRKVALEELSRVVTTILEPPEDSNEMLQLDLLIDAQELWALPFEAALAKDGTPLFARRTPATVLTRRAPREFVAHQLSWPARPRVLFAYASPDWAGGRKVEHSSHKTALLSALQPWIEPLPGQQNIFGREESVLTTLKDASVADIAQACRHAEADPRGPYTHVHLLAHGIKSEVPGYSHRTRFGIALRSEDKKSTLPEDLVQALWPQRAPDWQGKELPVVVTLAICDGGNAENSIIEAGGVAQELHRAGVPIVLASQLPLTFPGSEIMTRVFYEGWMAGKDVRAVLHETRVALHQADKAEHDWVSMVAYVRLPEGYNDYLLDIRLKSQLAALETASKHANYLIENNILEGPDYDQVTDRLRRRIERLEELLEEHKAIANNRKTEIVQENAGQLASAYKRLAELLANRAANDSENAKHWLAESGAALMKARDVYQQAFRHNPAHHWTGVQYLALDAILKGTISNLGEWYACYFAATAQRDNLQCNEVDRVWALGSIAELGLIAPLTAGAVVSADEAATAIADLFQRAKAKPELFPDLSPIDSTRRQLTRYVAWWKKTNGFFASRDSDLSAEAQKLIELLKD